eukprot:scaffold44_cov411-Prasinococcus_capsulatus_cf.AAC.58
MLTPPAWEITGRQGGANRAARVLQRAACSTPSPRILGSLPRIVHVPYHLMPVPRPVEAPPGRGAGRLPTARVRGLSAGWPWAALAMMVAVAQRLGPGGSPVRPSGGRWPRRPPHGWHAALAALLSPRTALPRPPAWELSTRGLGHSVQDLGYRSSWPHAHGTTGSLCSVLVPTDLPR